MQGSQPNIVFDIEVFDENGLNVQTFHGLTKPAYNFTYDPSHLYRFLITPMSNVQGATKGNESESLLLCSLGKHQYIL